MPYAVIALDKDGGGPLRAELRPEHLVHLERYAGKLLAGGAMLADDGATPVGSLLIIDSEDRAEVEAIVAADPFSKAGLFQSVSIRPWRKVYFDGAKVG